VAELLADEPAARARAIDYGTELLELHGAPPEVAARVRAVSDATRTGSISAKIDLPLATGDTVAAGGRSLRVLLAPGHSCTDTLFDDGDGVAFTGDHLLAAHGTALLAERPVRGPADPRLRRPLLPTYRESLTRTAALGLRVALPGHGEPIDDPAAVIRRRLDDQLMGTDRLHAAMPRTAVTAWELVVADRAGRALDDTDLPVAAAFIALSGVLAQLDLLAEQGRVREHRDEVLRYERVG
jgi:glyoxylase-like metal-dependent hydrolase (beta-lactamase superfamily II)